MLKISHISVKSCTALIINYIDPQQNLLRWPLIRSDKRSIGVVFHVSYVT